MFANSTVLRADATRYVTISQNYSEPWQKDDEVCITRSEKDIACGFIKFTEPESAIVKISSYTSKVEKTENKTKENTLIELSLDLNRPLENDGVRLVTKNPKTGINKILNAIATSNPFNSRKISFSQVDEDNNQIAKLEELRKLKKKIYWDDNQNVVSAVSIGLDYAWPYIEYTQSISSNIAMTLRAIKLNYPVADGILDGLGGYLTYNYYPFRPLRGLWFQSGLGVYSMKAIKDRLVGSTWTPGLINTIGYKVVWRDTLSFGFAGGLEYLPTVNMGNVKLDFTGILPSFLLSAGYFF